MKYQARWRQVVWRAFEYWELTMQNGTRVALCGSGVGDHVWNYWAQVPGATYRIHGMAIGVSRHEAMEEVEGALVTAGMNIGLTFIEPPQKP